MQDNFLSFSKCRLVKMLKLAVNSRLLSIKRLLQASRKAAEHGLQ